MRGGVRVEEIEREFRGFLNLVKRFVRSSL